MAKKITFLDLMASLVSILSGINGPGLILYSQFEGVTQISGLSQKLPTATRWSWVSEVTDTEEEPCIQKTRIIILRLFCAFTIRYFCLILRYG